jgi:hypothetical protein
MTLKSAFISYSRADKAVVQQITSDLKQRGMNIWIDQIGLTPGTLDWEDALREAIANADIVILAASPNSRRSRYVKDELRIAVHFDCQVLPVWVNGDSWIDCIPMGWGGTQYIDIRGSRYPSGITQIVEALTEPTENILSPSYNEQSDKAQVMLSYAYTSETDSHLALQIEGALTQKGYPIFVDDQAIPMGTRGANRIRQAIASSDFFIALISAETTDNQVFVEELQLVAAQPKTQILPVRVDYREEFPYRIRELLDPLPWAYWRGEQDTDQLLQDLINTLHGMPLPVQTISDKAALILADKPRTERPEPYADTRAVTDDLRRYSGTMSPSSRFYVYRQCDDDVHEEVQRDIGETVIIRAPRQMGKSSLLIRATQHAQERELNEAFIDLQLVDAQTLTDERAFYRWFARIVTRALKLDVSHIKSIWDDDISGVLLLTEYFEDYVLAELEHGQLLLIIDEVDRLLQSPFRSDFFGMLRNWHNNRSYNADWDRFTLMMAISTEPYMLIENLDQSPFNVGRVVMPEDFNVTQIKHLANEYRSRLSDADLERLHSFVGGHPFLTQTALFYLTRGNFSLSELIDTCLSDSSPFADHLRHFLFMLSQDEELEQAMYAITQGETDVHSYIVSRLQSAGLVRTSGSQPSPRCELYRHYFNRRLAPVYGKIQS